MAIDLTAIGATVYLDGVEILRNDCCVTEDREPTVGRPGLLDQSTRSSTTNDLHVLENLASGQHTIAASSHTSRSTSNRQFFDLRLFSPISEKPWKGGADDDWFNDDNWYFGTPGPTDFAVFRRENRARAQLDTPITLSGIQFDRLTGGHTVMGEGEIRLQGEGGGNGSLNATGGNHSLDVDIGMGSDVDAHIQAAMINVDGQLNLNGHTLTKTGDGTLTIMSHNVSGAGTILVKDGTLGGAGTFAGSVVTLNGSINPSDDSSFNRGRGQTLTVSGSIRGRVELDLYGVIDFDVLAGGGRGVAIIDHLKIDADRLNTYDGATFQLFPNWPSLSISEVELPDIGTAEWDTSRLQDGVLSVSHTNPNPCDFNASGFCNVGDLDLLTIDIVEGNNDPRFDMNGDELVDEHDVDIWLLDAALLNGFDSAYLRGDADLDGSVNAVDLMTVGLNWRGSVLGWSNADFTLDGVINAHDLNELAKNWQKTIPRRPAAVPEPMSFLLMFFGVGVLFQCTRRLRGRVLATLVITMTVLVVRI